MYTQEQKEIFKGIGALVLTPFDKDLKVNLDAIPRNVRYMVDNGITAENGFLIANGTMSECNSMNMEERKQVIKKVVEAAGDVPVLAGCNDTAAVNVIELARYSKEVGAKAALIVQPYYIPYNDEQIYSFYKYVNDNVDIPIMIYNNPLVGGRDISINLLRRLAKLDKIFALKQATLTTQLFVHSDVLADELLVFSASSSQQPFGTMAKMSGFVSFLSAVNPKMQVGLWKAIKKGDWQEALHWHAEELRLYDWWWSGGVTQPAGGIVHMKKAMDIIGLTGGYVRPPLLPDITNEEVEKLKDILKQWGLL